MATTWTVSNNYVTGTLDLTSSPVAILTNSSTYTRASAYSAITAQETSGGGYVRPSLTVSSNALNADGYGQIVYTTFSLTASGGNIVYDRLVLGADGDWVAYANFGTTTITSGSTKTYALQFIRGESGVTLSGIDGENSYTVTTGNFTQPAVSGTVAVSVENSGFLAVGSYCYFWDGTNAGWYTVSAIGGATSITLKNTGLGASAAPATTMLQGGQIVAGGVPGQDGMQLVTFTGSPASYTPTASGRLLVRTDVTPNLSYRTTGTTAGAVQLLGAYQTFTGSPASYTPTASGQLLVKSDVTPNTLWRSTGTTAGAVAKIGGSGGGGFLEGILVLSHGTTMPSEGEIGIDGSSFTDSTYLVLSDNGDANSDDWSMTGSGIRQDATIKVVGQESGAVAFLIVGESYHGDYGWQFNFPPTGFQAHSTGTFLDGEMITLSFAGGSGTLYSTKTANFNATYEGSTTYFVDCTAGNVTATLPLSSSSVPYRSHTFKRIDSTHSHTLTINRSGTDLIDGATSKSLSVLQYCTLTSDGVSKWWIT